MDGLVIGAVNIDIFADTNKSFEEEGIDLPGTITIAIGGTAFNVYTSLCCLGFDCFFLSALREGSLFTYLVKSFFKESKMKYDFIILPHLKESVFVALRYKGDLVRAVTSTSVEDVCSEDFISKLSEISEPYNFVVCDCNLNESTLEAILKYVNVPCYIQGTSEMKVTRLSKLSDSAKEKIKAIFLNEREFERLKSISPLFRGPFTFFVTLGEKGVKVIYPSGEEKYFPPVRISEAESFSGCGDIFTAGVIYGFENGYDIDTSVFFGFGLVVEKIRYSHANLIKRAHDSILEYAIPVDGLTGCPTRFVFELEKERFRRESRFYTVMFIDLDNFKRVNDTFGHLVGDKVLKRVAEIMRKQIRQEDRLYRYGGEEFLIVCRTSPEGAFVIAERIRKEIEKEMKEKYGVTVTIGISRIEDSIEEAIENADRKLYSGKFSGKNKVVF